jgi:peptide-methionine (S)-S-oxide reductase
MKESSLEKATFAAGCFWGVEAAFRQLPGVVSTRVGYTGGHTDDPTYERVCSHTTGHAEAVEVTFDAQRVSYEQLLDVFWTKHNPTTKNRQGLDIGDQYRSAIFFHSPEQQEAAEQTKEAVQAKLHWPRKVVTEIVPAREFYEAEEYHQQYLEKLGRSNRTVELAETPGGSFAPH